MRKPSVGIFGLTGCAGDQLVVLNCEDELLDLIELLDIRDFLMASSDNDEACRLDVAMVEGAVLSRRDEERLRQIRARSDMLVAIGTCAVWGGVAAMDRDADRARLLGDVYRDYVGELDSIPARALHEVVRVDLSVSGCPIEKEQFLSVVANLLHGNPPLLHQYPVCTECKMREYTCLLTENGTACCGPLTVAGCGARCPGLGVPCIGCRGPTADLNVHSAIKVFEERGVPRDAIARKLRTFAPIPLATGTASGVGS